MSNKLRSPVARLAVGSDVFAELRLPVKCETVAGQNVDWGMGLAQAEFVRGSHSAEMRPSADP